VQVVPGSFGSFAGIRTDGQARVLGRDGAPIAGLFAAGADMASIMGGHYPAGESTWGRRWCLAILRQKRRPGEPHWKHAEIMLHRCNKLLPI
jgi:hypothetical protein